MTGVLRHARRLPGSDLEYCSLADAAAAWSFDLGDLPFTVRLLLENVLRTADEHAVTGAVALLLDRAAAGTDFDFRPGRVLMQDFTGVPALVDLAALREAAHERGIDPRTLDFHVPACLVVDHSLRVDRFRDRDAAGENLARERARNRERYDFLRWAQQSFSGLTVVPPGAGIVHQINLERLATVVEVVRRPGSAPMAVPDTVVGTDSHTTMVNALGVLGWGTGGLEAETVLLGRPVTLSAPVVVGVRLTGKLPAGTTAGDLALHLTETLRAADLRGAYVEFLGDGVEHLDVPDRATVANMAPEYGAMTALFPVDDRTLEYLTVTGRSPEQVALVERYARAQHLFRDPSGREPTFGRTVTLSLEDVEPCLAGPRRPQDRVRLRDLGASFRASVAEDRPAARTAEPVDGLPEGAIGIAAITSCTTTSNPALMIGAGLTARNAIRRGLTVPAHVKTTLAPGSRTVPAYLRDAGLLEPLEQLGFHVVGFACTTCHGMSGDLVAEAERAAKDGTVVAAVLSGNRNFAGRVHPLVRANYLTSPQLVVALAIAGTVDLDPDVDPIATDPSGRPVHLHELLPTQEEVAAVVRACQQAGSLAVTGDLLREAAVPGDASARFAWDPASTYLRRPPLAPPPDRTGPLLAGGRVLLMLGDAVTTDHISPVGRIAADSPAGRWLSSHGVPDEDFDSYGSRRGNHEVMLRGTFGHPQLRNQLVPQREGPVTVHQPSGSVLTVHEAALRHRMDGAPLVVLAGRDYGAGSSRDWAAKGTALLGVRVVIAQSFERIHRLNLVSVGVLPLEYTDGQTADTLGLDGSETFEIADPLDELEPGRHLAVAARHPDGTSVRFTARACLATTQERDILRAGGVFTHTLDRLELTPGIPTQENQR